MPMILAICHSESEGWTEVGDISAVSDLRKQAGRMVWAEADVSTLTPEDVEVISEEFDLHPLAVEDAVNTRQRPKLEQYDPHLFVVMHQLDTVNAQLEARQIACFIGEGYVLTVHDGARRTMDEAKRRWDKSAAGHKGRSLLIYTLLDTIVDDYQEIADQLETEIETLEETVLASPGARVQKELYSVKQRLSRLRRYALPVSRSLEQVVGPDRPAQFSEVTAALFRDVTDHVLRVTDQLRSVETLSDAVLDLQRSEEAMALSEVTKRLTGWAAIIAIPTLIASIYGMNFALVPDEGRLFGFWFAVGLMGTSGLVLYIWFKKRRWI